MFTLCNFVCTKNVYNPETHTDPRMTTRIIKNIAGRELYWSNEKITISEDKQE